MTAHTPLLRSLQRLFRDHQLARAHGIPVEALPDLRAQAREHKPPPRLSRRAFLAGAFASATALALGLDRPSRAADTPRIAIVGAGIAGLSCALDLRDRGVHATVYEASDRVGGRMFSNIGYFDEGQVSEWCAELIDTDNLALHRLAARFGLTVDDLHAGQAMGAEETYYLDGAYYPKAQADADFGAVYEALAKDLAAAGCPTTYDACSDVGRALDATSVHDWIEQRVPGGHTSPLGRLLDVAYVIQHGADTADQSALNLIYFLGHQPAMTAPPLMMFGISDERYHVRGGNQRIPEAIARSLGDAVVRGHRLIRLARTPAGRSALTFATNQGDVEVVADLVVLALPFAVLRDVDLAGAGFDERKMRAIRELGCAHNGKTHVQFTDRIWTRPGPWPHVSNGSSYSDTGYQNTWEVSRGQCCNSGILVFYTGGPVTDAMVTRTAFSAAPAPGVLTDAAIMLDRAEPVFPGLRARWNGKATQSLPHLSDLRKASYVYRRVGQYTAFGGYEGVRQGNVLFCGEHTSLTHPAHMEGAAREGLRAAHDIAEILSLPSPMEARP
ncbi:MAG: NAD(P)/FAD-dependent oxidoreductase [Minicystis sp.]